MILSDTAIKRPVFTTMLVVSLLLFGYLGIRGMGVDQFPRVDFPIVTITTVLPGASPEIVESDITQPIEEQLNTIEGVKHVTSTSSLGASVIAVEFELERDIDVAAQDVRDKVALARRDLPSDAEDPVIQKVDVNAQPVLWITLAGLDVKTMSQFADEVLKPRLQTLPGVGDVRIGGFRAREMRLWINRDRLESRRLTVTDVIRAVQTKNVELPAGVLEAPETELRINVRGQLASANEFNELVVAYRDGAPVRLRDIGYAEDGVEPRRSLARFNGRAAVGLGVAPRPGSNTVAVAGLVRDRLEDLRANLPSGMEAAIAFDASHFIEDSIRGAADELFFGAFFAVVVVFAFLRSWRSTLVIALTIPTSLIATFGAMRVLGFSINNLTMLALSLSVGVVVDDAIVVLESIFHHLERGEDPREAARVGASEIAFAAIAATISIAAVFIPVAIVPGLIGRFMFQFGISVAAAVLFSLLVALTLTPMLAALFVHHETKHGRVYRWLEAAFARTDDTYRRLLDWALAHRLPVLALGAGAFVLAVALLPLVGTEFVPNQDESRFIVRLRSPLGSSLDYTDRYLAEAERRLLADSAVQTVFSAVGLGGGGGAVDQAFAFVNLAPRSQRERSQDEIMAHFRAELNAIPGVTAFVERASIVGGGQRSTPVQLVLRGPELEGLAAGADGIVASLRQLPGFVDVDHDLQLRQPEVNIAINRDVAASVGLDVLSVSQVVNAMIGGVTISTFKTGGQRYDVRIQVLPEQRAGPGDLGLLTARTPSGALVPLAGTVRVTEGVGPSAIQRLDQQRAVNIFANLNDVPLGDALPQALNAARANVPPAYSVATSGQSEQFGEAFGDLLFAIGLAVIVIFIVLAIQFEHFVHPLTLMLALPLAATGAFALMVLTGTRLGIIGMIGMILLMGIVMKNSILLIDLTNKLREQGMEMVDALKTACPRRLRPILMTSAAIMFGVFPVAAQLTEGSELRAPMAIAVLGGVFSSTILTLLVVPVVYTYLDGLPRRLGELSARAVRLVSSGRRALPAPGTGD